MIRPCRDVVMISVMQTCDNVAGRADEQVVPQWTDRPGVCVVGRRNALSRIADDNQGVRTEVKKKKKKKMMMMTTE
jgi:hypothetical protein